MHSNVARDLAVAYVAGDHRFVQELSPVPDALKLAVHALRCGLATGTGEASHEDISRAITAALAQPVDPHLELLLHRLNITLLAYEGKLDQAWQEMTHIERLAVAEPPELATIPSITKWRLLRLMGEDRAASEVLSTYDWETVITGSRVWCSMKTAHLQSCLESWNFSEAHDILHQLNANEVNLTAYGMAPRIFLSLALALESADYTTAATCFQRLTTEQLRSNPGIVAEYQLALHLAEGQTDKVLRRLTAWMSNESDVVLSLNRIQLEPLAATVLMTEALLAKGEIGEAQAIITACDEPTLPRNQRALAMIRAEVALAQGDRDAARSLLQPWPKPDQWLPAVGPHIRLALMDGSLDLAAAMANRVIAAAGIPLLGRCLRFGGECSMRYLGPLFARLTHALPKADKPTASWKNTHDRRRYLSSLFHDHGSLTRADIVRRLHVAPGTVTTDLKYLIAQGLIRRVSPSSSSRSDYFELVP